MFNEDERREVKAWTQFSSEFLGMLCAMADCGHDTIESHYMYRPAKDSPFFRAVVNWLATGKGFDEVMELHPTKDLIRARMDECFSELNLFASNTGDTE
jgi:hypothetical protein